MKDLTFSDSYSIHDIAQILKDEKQLEQYYVGTYEGKIPGEIFPRRAMYYGLAICTQGHIDLIANLELYQLKKGSLIVMPPETIRIWRNKSDDYSEETLLFSEQLFPSEITLQKFRFFAFDSPKVIHLAPEEEKQIYGLLQELKKTGTIQSPRKLEIGKAYISIILHTIADLYDKYTPFPETKSTAAGQIVTDFKRLLIASNGTNRNVSRFAEMLNVSTKHLSETMKQHTGKTAGEWIRELVILEAKVKLEQTDLNVNQIADILQFADATSFGKYFKKNAGLSPQKYRELTYFVNFKLNSKEK